MEYGDLPVNPASSSDGVPQHADGYHGDRALLLAAFRATWADGVCTDTGIYFDPVEMPLLSMYTRGIQFSTGRVSARAAIPAVLELLARGVDVGPVVDRVVPWDDAPEVWASMCAKTVFSRLS